MFEKKVLLNGAMFFGEDHIEIRSSLTNEVIGKVPALEKENIDYAFSSARKAFPKWSNLDHQKRIEYILKFSEIMMEKKEFLATQMVKEISKNYSDCLKEIERTNDYIKQTIDCYLEKFINPEIVGEESTKIKGKTGFFKRVPVGVVLAISPFNYPINLSLSKIIPALILGNTVVFKPATQAAISATILADFFYKAKFPAGSINVVTAQGSQMGDCLIQNKEVNAISFTGSSQIGKQICQTRGDANLVLELGGKDPAIVKKDCDLDLAVKEIISGAFNYSGQRCTAIKVVYADANLEKELTKKLKEKILNLKIGSPYDNVDIVPLINNKSLQYALELIQDSKSKNFPIIIGGQHDGNFLFPTLIKSTTLNSRIMLEEQFAPVLPIYFYEKDGLPKVISAINKSKYALQVSIFTKNKEKFWEIAEQLDVGTVNWNKASSRGPDIFPFIGIRDSGKGVQGIYYALESMARIKGFIENK